MEHRILFGLLMVGEGMLTPNYILFCFCGSLGTLQFAAATYHRSDLTPLPGPWGKLLGIALVVCAFVWFFTVQPDLFIPGLAGGEFVVYSAVGFALAFIVSRAAAAVGVWFAAARAHSVRRETRGDSRT